MIKAVVFDADGVLTNAERFSIQLERAYGIPHEKVLPFFTGVFQQCLIGKAELRKEIEPYLHEWGWKEGVDELLKFWFTAEHKVDEEVLAIAKSLREKVPVFMATNQEQCRIDYMTTEMKFGEVFTKIYSSAGMGHMKTNPGFFTKMLDDMKKNYISDIQAQEVLFFDDSQENVDSAMHAGVQGVLFSGIDGFKKKLSESGL